MKFIRYQDSSQNIHYGSQEADQTFRIEGDIFADYSVTTDPADIAKRLAPISPEIIQCIGLNYRKHAEETGAKIPQNPVVFVKGRSATQNPGDPVELPRTLASHKVDYECELAIVIGKTCKNATKENAFDYVLGYTCANDISARDWQKEWGGGQWSRAKSFDTFCPLGPTLVTHDEIGNPNDLKIKTVLNGQTMQDWTTGDMIFDVPTLIEFLSGSTTLLPGTVVLTGTPHGVGMARTPPVWLKPGDQLTVEIEKIGTLTNPIIEEPT